MKNLYKIEDELYVVSDKEKSSYCIKECPMAGLSIDRCDCPIQGGCSNKVGTIILTTNKLLIKDGIQAIDDEFLEWFVKNPSCEEFEVEKEQYNTFVGRETFPMKPSYKIIIPKEEPFKHTCRVLTTEEVMAGRSSAYEFIDFDKQEMSEENYLFTTTDGVKIFKGDKYWYIHEDGKRFFENNYALKKYMIDGQINFSTPEKAREYLEDNKPKQETLEEAAERIPKEIDYSEFDEASFKLGAKWQAERMYSEKDMHKLMDEYQDWLMATEDICKTFKEWFEQFKKK